MPPFFLFVSLTILFGSISGFLTYLARKHLKINVLRSHNEVTGFVFLAVTNLYALLLSFVVFVVWGQLNSTRDNVSKEGSSAMGLYRDIKYYPDSLV